MKGIIKFEIKKIAGMDFKQFEEIPQIRKEFENHCKKIIEALVSHFKKYKIEIKAKYEIEK